MKSLSKVIPMLVIFSLLLVGCKQNNQPSDQTLQTEVVQTVVALQTQAALQPTAAASTSAVATGSVPVSTEVPVLIPTFTSVPTLLSTATAIPPTPTQAVTLAVAKVVSITNPSGTVLQGGQSFVETWKITNGGSAAWGANYKIIFTSGDYMGINSVTLGKVIYPNQTTEVSVTLTAPIAAGTHTANFLMSTDNGVTFGLGSNFDRPWSIQITVQNLFAVTSASVSASPSSYSGSCPTTINLTPSITANGTGTVTYYLNIAGNPTDTYSMTFTAAGTQSGQKVAYVVNSSTSLNIKVYIDYPNHQNFGSLTIPITCTP